MSDKQDSGFTNVRKDKEIMTDSSQEETINFPSLDTTDAAQTFLENERDSKDQRGGKRGLTKGIGRHTDILQTFFNDLDYKQLCLLLKMANVKAEECRQEAARIVQEGIVAGDVDVTRVEEYDETVADNSLDEFGKYVVAMSAGTTATEREPDNFKDDGFGFLAPPRNRLEFGTLPEDVYGTTGRRLKRARRRGEVCVSIEAHAWQVPDAQDLYYQAAIFQAVVDRTVELLRYKFDQHHADIGAELVLNVLTEMIGE